MFTCHPYLQVIKDDCQADLDEAMPAYKASIRALDSLDKKSIQEMKVRRHHPGWNMWNWRGGYC